VVGAVVAPVVAAVVAPVVAAVVAPVVVPDGDEDLEQAAPTSITASRNIGNRRICTSSLAFGRGYYDRGRGSACRAEKFRHRRKGQ
jgi:hypothetical protein